MLIFIDLIVAGYIGVTDRDWFEFNRKNKFNEVIFWRTAKKPVNLHKGCYFFFLIKGIRLVQGYGIVSKIGTETIKNLWSKFKKKLGCTSVNDLILKLGKNKEDEIGFYLLKDVKYFSGGIDLEELKIEFSPKIVSGKRIKKSDVKKLINIFGDRTKLKKPSKYTKGSWKHKPRLTKLHKLYWESLKRANKKFGRPVSKTKWLEQAKKDGVKTHLGAPPRSISSHMIWVLSEKGNLEVIGDKFLACGKIGVEEKKPKRWKEFEQDIIKFLDKLGFDDVLSEPETKKIFGKEIDVCGGFRDILFFIECRWTSKKGKKPITSAINDIVTNRRSIIQAAKKDPTYSKYRKFEFIIATKNYVIGKADKKKAEKHHIHLWDERLVDYYTMLIKDIGKYARFNLFGEMKISPPEDRLIRTLAIQKKIGKYVLYNFFMTPDDLLEISYVARRLRGEKEFYQRIIKKNRLGRIAKKFIEEGGIFPNNIIISLGKKSKFIPLKLPKGFSNIEIGILQFPNKYSSCFIIDGQHRLYAFSKTEKKIPLPVVAFKSLNRSEQMNFFVDINEKQKKINPNLLWDLYGDLHPKTMEGIISRSIKELNKLEPFFNKNTGKRKYRIYIPFEGTKKKGDLNLSGLCNSLKKCGLVKEKTRHIVDRKNPFYSKRPKETVKRVSKGLSTFFRIVDRLFDKKQKEFVFRSDGGISVMVYFYEKLLLTFKSIPSEEELIKYLGSLKKYLDGEDLDTLRGRCTSEEMKDRVLDDFIEFVAIDQNDEILKQSVKRKEYEKKIREIERKIGSFINVVFTNQVSPTWLRERVEKKVFMEARDRLERKVPEDPGTEIHEFFTLGELYNIINRKDNWKVLQKYFVNVRTDIHEDKFINDNEFFGAIERLNKYRNPPSHGRRLKLTRENLELIEIALSKINKCMDRGIKLIEKSKV